MTTAIPSTSSSKKSRTVYDVIENDVYDARIVRFIGLGVQEQPEWQGERKAPAFKCSIAFELIDIDATGRTFEGDDDKVGKPIDPRPSCQFKDYFLFPGAKRGGVFDLCKAIDPTITEVPRNLEWFMDKLGEVVSVGVGSYTTKQGITRNKVTSVGAVSSRNKSKVGEARSELVAFNPYSDTPAMTAAYAKVYKFQRDMLTEAKDAQHIPYAGKEPVNDGGDGDRPDNTTTREEEKYGSNTNTRNTPNDVAFDDDIPF
ncbi:hypothetical protein [Salmonella phage 7-11]|uniref:Uncharacterized protein n=1 Tax=Salmonella phage 7-11 TaxID=1054968 RepID=G0X4Y1_9CAUD|nr:hypothetical protein SaPh711_gp048 [Salmonella phage 7-11]AEK81963.1 hypothetical protein [Salmonella phage 7-11]